jgi:hypothetical protein
MKKPDFIINQYIFWLQNRNFVLAKVIFYDQVKKTYNLKLITEQTNEADSHNQQAIRQGNQAEDTT